MYLVHNAGQAVVLGFQHYILTLGITVLIPTIIVPQMGGGDVRIFSNPFSFDVKFKQLFNEQNVSM
jgi:hypothetical protein